ncbi:GNAT family N-acetyltransferase [Salinicoccus bachuensis]|uniref:GNAT family N-acetyltransferase n=1 Tax=Salinicoccus bachuensis TaxID=3136731 RepID=A0ABZ3CLR7_9STAP
MEFIEINEDNFWKIINMEVNENQAGFVAPNVKSLAEAYLYRNDDDVIPYAIQDQDEVVGFILIDIDAEKREFMIWRMMIDKRYQKRGYGKQTIQKAIEMARKTGKYDVLVADYVKENEVMGKLLKSIGFYSHSFDEENNEYVLHYEL